MIASVKPETFPKLNFPKPFDLKTFEKGRCYYVSVKLDGIRAVYYNGELYNKCWEIIPDKFCQETLEFSKSNLACLPNGAEGVLNHDFGETCDTSYRFTKIGNILYDRRAYLQSEPCYVKNYNNKFTQSFSNSRLFHIKEIPVFDLAEIYGYLSKWTKEGYSGLIIKQFGDTYQSTKTWRLEPDCL